MSRSPGGYIGFNRTPTSAAASGIWTLNEAQRYTRASAWPFNGADPNFSNVSLLLRMDGSNGSASFTDVSGTPKTITASGNAQISTAQSKFGGASGYFDGTGDYLKTNSSSGFAFSGAFTVEAWIYVSSWPSQFWLVDFRDGGNFALGFGSGRFYPFLGGTDWGSGTGSAFATNEWIHFAFSYDGSECRMYANGSLVRTVTESGRTQGNCAATIGAKSNGSAEFFNGYMDDLRITIGVSRYSGSTFSVPTATFPSS